MRIHYIQLRCGRSSAPDPSSYGPLRSAGLSGDAFEKSESREWGSEVSVVLFGSLSEIRMCVHF